MIKNEKLLDKIESLFNIVFEYSEEDKFELFKNLSFEKQQELLAEALEIVNENL